MGHREPIIVVHGGAGTIPETLRDQVKIAIREAAEVGWKVLKNGGTALDAVEKAVMNMEDSPMFNAGFGSVLTEEGTLEMDAMIVDGKAHAVGGVAGVSRIRNPIHASRVIMEKSPHVLFIGEGAEKFYQAKGYDLVEPETLISERSKQRLERYRAEKKQYGDYIKPGGDPERREKYGTVGAVALDVDGNLAAATSTGGVLGKLPGRVGDTPIFGAGTYADDELAFSATGVGEVIIKSVLGMKMKEGLIKGMTTTEAADFALKYLKEVIQGEAGLIAVTSDGSYVAQKTTKDLAFAVVSNSGILDFTEIGD